MTVSQYDERLKMLREEWLRKPADRKIIEYRAKLLKMARDEASPDVKNVVETLC